MNEKNGRVRVAFLIVFVIVPAACVGIGILTIGLVLHFSEWADKNGWLGGLVMAGCVVLPTAITVTGAIIIKSKRALGRYVGYAMVALPVATVAYFLTLFGC